MSPPGRGGSRTQASGGVRVPLPTPRQRPPVPITSRARSAISRHRRNHWLFSRYSMTSPERLQGC